MQDTLRCVGRREEYLPAFVGAPELIGDCKPLQDSAVCPVANHDPACQPCLRIQQSHFQRFPFAAVVPTTDYATQVAVEEGLLVCLGGANDRPGFAHTHGGLEIEARNRVGVVAAPGLLICLQRFTDPAFAVRRPCDPTEDAPHPPPPCPGDA